MNTQPSEEPDAVYPTFFVVGAAKTGTTSLHEYLNAHPEIAMTQSKEPHFMAADDWRFWATGYAPMFEKQARVRGESSTGYTAYPWAPEDLPVRIRTLVPDARLIYVVRDPIERVRTHYVQSVVDERISRPFDQLVDDPDSHENLPVWSSRYATQFERYLAHFDRSDILVLDQADLLSDRRGVLRSIFEFLDVDADYWSEEFERMHNTHESRRRRSFAARAVDRLGGNERRLRLMHSQRPLVKRLATRIFTSEVAKPDINDEQRARLAAVLAPEAARFRELTGMAFEHWSV